MKQDTVTDIEYGMRKKKTKREEFLEIMDEIIPWDEWVGVIEPYYPRGKRGRPPMRIEKMQLIGNDTSKTANLPFAVKWSTYSELYSVSLATRKWRTEAWRKTRIVCTQCLPVQIYIRLQLQFEGFPQPKMG